MVRRFAPIEQVRFCNSGTEATMDALRLARAHAGRDKVVKIEGSYHGHHDTVLMSTKPSVEAAGPADRPNSVPASKGIPSNVKENTIIAPYNDPEALERILSEHKGEVAAVITEAVLMNVGIMLPDEGYLQSLRDIPRRHGVLLIFDEVKTGVTVAPGGITELYPVEPDLICLAKSIGGGTPIGAFGGREDVMRHINHEEVVHLGTFNGNPMSMRAGLVTLTQILTPEAHAHASGLSKQLGDSYMGMIDEFNMPSMLLKLVPRAARCSVIRLRVTIVLGGRSICASRMPTGSSWRIAAFSSPQALMINGRSPFSTPIPISIITPTSSTSSSLN